MRMSIINDGPCARGGQLVMRRGLFALAIKSCVALPGAANCERV